MLNEDQELIKKFNARCGNIQCLVRKTKDLTTIDYHEKLERALRAILLDDELIKKIKQAFETRIFLSYRKKDRIFAWNLMKIIHKDDSCRDVSIWFDEYLVPGEYFDDAIKMQLSQADLIVFVVTPNLNERPNFVMTAEYPLSKLLKKPLIAVEMKKTDISQLRTYPVNIGQRLIKTSNQEMEKIYKEWPDTIKKKNQRAIVQAVQDILSRTALQKNKEDPYHEYFVGLAYLLGIEVEIDHVRAVDLITKAALCDEGVTDAVKKLRDMYWYGQGVERKFAVGLSLQKSIVNKKATHCSTINEKWDFLAELKFLAEMQMINPRKPYDLGSSYHLDFEGAVKTYKKMVCVYENLWSEVVFSKQETIQYIHCIEVYIKLLRQKLNYRFLKKTLKEAKIYCHKVLNIIFASPESIKKLELKNALHHQVLISAYSGDAPEYIDLLEKLVVFSENELFEHMATKESDVICQGDLRYLFYQSLDLIYVCRRKQNWGKLEETYRKLFCAIDTFDKQSWMNKVNSFSQKNLPNELTNDLAHTAVTDIFDCLKYNPQCSLHLFEMVNKKRQRLDLILKKYYLPALEHLIKDLQLV